MLPVFVTVEYTAVLYRFFNKSRTRYSVLYIRVGRAREIFEHVERATVNQPTE
jgi:hypothetical protein